MVGVGAYEESSESTTQDKLKDYERRIMEIRQQRGKKQKAESPRMKITEELKKFPEIRDGLYYKLKNKKSHNIPLLSKSHERIPADDMLRRIERGSARLSG